MKQPQMHRLLYNSNSLNIRLHEDISSLFSIIYEKQIEIWFRDFKSFGTKFTNTAICINNN